MHGLDGNCTSRPIANSVISVLEELVFEALLASHRSHRKHLEKQELS